MSSWLAHLLVIVLTLACVAPAIVHAALIDKGAPGFTRKDLAGRRVNLRSYRGKVVLLNFWATWCAPCKKELTRFAEWQHTYGENGLQVIAVSMDDNPAAVRALLDKLSINYPVVMGDAKLGLQYGGVLGLPVTFLIGRDGKIEARMDGETDLRLIEERVKRVLTQPTR